MHTVNTTISSLKYIHCVSSLKVRFEMFVREPPHSVCVRSDAILLNEYLSSAKILYKTFYLHTALHCKIVFTQ
eukprot:UN13086